MLIATVFYAGGMLRVCLTMSLPLKSELRELVKGRQDSLKPMVDEIRNIQKVSTRHLFQKKHRTQSPAHLHKVWLLAAEAVFPPIGARSF